MANLVPLYDDKKPFVTADGSISFYNTSYLEAYHAKSIGAYTESLYKFVYASGILKRLETSEVRLLDLCFGLGYNLAVTIHELLKSSVENRLKITSLEIDKGVVDIVRKTYFFWPVDAYRVLRTLLEDQQQDQLSLEMVYGDATQTVHQLKHQYDIVYFDPFSKRKTPELWTPEMFQRMHEVLADDGCLVTYSCAKGVRKDLKAAGFYVYDVDRLPDGFQRGTICYKYLQADREAVI